MIIGRAEFLPVLHSLRLPSDSATKNGFLNMRGESTVLAARPGVTFLKGLTAASQHSKSLMNTFSSSKFKTRFNTGAGHTSLLVTQKGE